MAKALSLHIGLNRIDPQHYGTEGLLSGCVNDARAMQTIASARGFTTTLLLDGEAGADRVLSWLDTAARSTGPGDTVVVTYAGHGSQVADMNNPPEPDGQDETWCLFNRMLVDDELARCWSRFSAGVRILLISDSCHSATIARALRALSASRSVDPGDASAEDLPLIGRAFGPHDAIQSYRVLPDLVPTRAERAFRELYRDVQLTGPGSEDIPIAATVLSLSACQDDETAGDGSGHGVFTQALLDTWAEGTFRGTYRQFFASIKAAIQIGKQNPEYRINGTPNPGFESEHPFSSSSTGRTSKEESMISNDSSLEERFEALVRRSNGARQHMETSTEHDFCRMQLFVPREAVIGRTDQEVADFLQDNGLPTLIKGFLAASSVRLTARPIEGGISCSADTKGSAGCKAEVSIRF